MYTSIYIIQHLLVYEMATGWDVGRFPRRVKILQTHRAVGVRGFLYTLQQPRYQEYMNANGQCNEMCVPIKLQVRDGRLTVNLHSLVHPLNQNSFCHFCALSTMTHLSYIILLIIVIHVYIHCHSCVY